MTPEEFFESFVIENYIDFKDNPGCVRRAFNSAVAAAHLADHYYNYYDVKSPSRLGANKKLGDYLNYISTRTQCYFKDIRSIANAYKHLYTGKESSHAKHSTISSAGTIESLEFIDEELESLSGEFEEQSTPEYFVVYTRKSGEKIIFKTALETVIDFWKNELFSDNA